MSFSSSKDFVLPIPITLHCKRLPRVLELDVFKALVS